MKRVVIVGAGFGGLGCARILASQKNQFTITLISEDPLTTFTPLLGEVATGLLLPEDVQEPLTGAFGGRITVAHDRVLRIDTHTHVVQGSHEYPYDYLVLSSGSHTDFHDVPGAWRYAQPLKTVKDAVTIRDRILSQLCRAVNEPEVHEREALMNLTVVGGGATGVTIAADLKEFTKRLCAQLPKGAYPLVPQVMLLCRGPELLSGFPVWMRRRSADFLARGGVEVRFNTSVAQVEEDAVVLTQKERIPTRTVVWLAGVTPRTVPIHPEAQCDEKGRWVVDRYLRLAQHEHEFAVGDVAAITQPGGAAVPALAQSAEDAGEAVAWSILRHEQKRALVPFCYRQKGLVVTVGRFLAFGYILGVPVAGTAAWFGLRFFYAFKSMRWRVVFRRLYIWSLAAVRPRYQPRYERIDK